MTLSDEECQELLKLLNKTAHITRVGKGDLAVVESHDSETDKLCCRAFGGHCNFDEWIAMLKVTATITTSMV